MEQQSPLLKSDSDTDVRMVIEKKELRTHYDYYKELASSKSIKPICITEGVDFSAMSKKERAYWWFKTFLQLLTLIILSFRSDRLAQPQYMKHHKKHYLGMVMISLLGWSPQILDSVSVWIYGVSIIPRISLSEALVPCIFGLSYYIIGITFFFECIGPFLRNKYGKAKTLKIWEYYVSITWQVQTLGFWVLTITPPLFQEEFKVVPEWVTTTLGLLLVIAGVGCKMGAVYGTGFNTYYWYDMITHIPNSHFVQVGIYKHCGSPTYTLGRFTGFGAALHYRSVPVFVASIVDLITINLFNQFVEQPFVRKMYIERTAIP